jgi:hypothetical protein
MDPDFFEVVMGAGGTLKFVPVTEQAQQASSCSSMFPHAAATASANGEKGRSRPMVVASTA